MTQDDRKSFVGWKTEIVYAAQEGRCGNCGKSLESSGFFFDEATNELREKIVKRFDKHHDDKDHSNDFIYNEVLLCPECHHGKAGSGNPYTEHQVQEKAVLDKVNKVIDYALDNKFSGAAMEKVTELMTLSLKVSRNATGIDDGIFYVPTAIKMQRKLSEVERDAETYTTAYMQAVRDTLSRVEVKKK